MQQTVEPCEIAQQAAGLGAMHSGGSMPESAKKLGVGGQLGNYVLEQQLGEGAQAEVYLARDIVLQRQVAVKVLHRSADSREPSREGLEEARLIATLEHPNIVRVYHVGRAAGIWYMAMEHVRGSNLRELVRQRGVLEPVEALRYFRSAAEALRSAHEVGVIHRDVKPHNLLVTYTGEVKLVDFGLAALSAPGGATDRRRVGTPEYLPPEVWLERGASPPSDVYSLGATLFFVVTGRPPFLPSTIDGQKAAHLNNEVTLPESVPAVIRSLVAKCMAKDPQDRPQTARDLIRLADDAVRILTGDRRRTRRASTGPVVEAIPGFEYADRERANTAVLSLPWYQAIIEQLTSALISGPPFVVFRGDRQLQGRIVRDVCERNAETLYVTSRIVLGTGGMDLVGVLCERLKVLRAAIPKVYDHIIDRWDASVGPDVDMRRVLHVHVRDDLSPADSNTLTELGCRVPGRDLVLLAVCSRDDGSRMHRELESMGHGTGVADIELPQLSAARLRKYVELWSDSATARCPEVDSGCDHPA